jgi:hypothetical protein
VLFQLAVSNLLLGKPLAGAEPPRIVPGPAELAHAARVFAENGLGTRPVAIFNLRAPKYAHIGRWGTERFARVAEELSARGADLVSNGGLEEQADELESLPPHLRREVTVIGGHTRSSSPRSSSAATSSSASRRGRRSSRSPSAPRRSPCRGRVTTATRGRTAGVPSGGRTGQGTGSSRRSSGAS